MTKVVVAVLVAVLLGLTTSPADARPLHSKGERRVEPVAACARIIMVEDDEKADCTKPSYCHKRHAHRQAKHVRKHRRHTCLRIEPLTSAS